MRLPGSRQRTESIRLDDRKNIASWIFEPGNRRSVPAHDPFLVCLQVTLIVMLEPHPALCQLVDRTVDIVHRKIENGERRRNVIRLRINENIIAARQMHLSRPWSSDVFNPSV